MSKTHKNKITKCKDRANMSFFCFCFTKIYFAINMPSENVAWMKRIKWIWSFLTLSMFTCILILQLHCNKISLYADDILFYLRNAVAELDCYNQQNPFNKSIFSCQISCTHNYTEIIINWCKLTPRHRLWCNVNI